MNGDIEPRLPATPGDIEIRGPRLVLATDRADEITSKLIELEAQLQNASRLGRHLGVERSVIGRFDDAQHAVSKLIAAVSQSTR